MCFISVQKLYSFNIPVRHYKMIEIPLKFKIKIKLQRIVIFEVPKYSDKGDSKAKRLRTFWEKESNLLVAESIEKMIEWWESEKLINEEEVTNNEKAMAKRCKEIAQNIKNKEISCVQKEEIEFLNKKFDAVNISALY